MAFSVVSARLDSESLAFTTQDYTNISLKVTPTAQETLTFYGQTTQTVTLANVKDPTSAQDAATKNYVDSLVNGLAWKEPAYLATTANISVTSAAGTFDGIAPYTADVRILVKNQTSSIENGIYTWSTLGVAMTRTADFPTGGDLAVYSASAIFVQAGSSQADSAWVETVDTGIIGTDPNTWVQFSSTGGSAAGNQYDVQFRGASPGQFAATDNFQYNNTTGELSLGGTPSILVSGTGAQFDLTEDGTLTINAQTQPTILSNVDLLIVADSASELMLGTNASVGGQVTIGNVAAVNNINATTTNVTGTIDLENELVMYINAGASYINDLSGTALNLVASAGDVNISPQNTDVLNLATNLTTGGQVNMGNVAGINNIYATTTNITGTVNVNNQIFMYNNVGLPHITGDQTMYIESTNGDINVQPESAANLNLGNNIDVGAINIGTGLTSGTVNIGSATGVNNLYATTTNVQSTLNVLDRVLVYNNGSNGVVNAPVGSLQLLGGDVDVLAGNNTLIYSANETILTSTQATTITSVLSDITIQPCTNALLNLGNTGVVTTIYGDVASTSKTTGTLVIDGTGGIGVGGSIWATSFNTSSDVNLKENIVPLDMNEDPLEVIKRVNGYSYNWKNKNLGTRLEYGVLAQQLEEAGLGNLVSGTDEKAVNYLGLIPLLIEAVKKLDDKTSKPKTRRTKKASANTQ